MAANIPTSKGVNVLCPCHYYYLHDDSLIGETNGM